MTRRGLFAAFTGLLASIPALGRFAYKVPEKRPGKILAVETVTTEDLNRVAALAMRVIRESLGSCRARLNPAIPPPTIRTSGGSDFAMGPARLGKESSNLGPHTQPVT